MRISVLYVIDTLELGSRGRQRFLDRPWAWIGASVSRAELTAVWQLARRLQSGESPAEILVADGGSSIMLRHLIAGEFDSEYRLSLRMVHILDPLASSSRIRTLLGKLRTNVWQRRERLDRLYGRPRSQVGYAGLRLWRLIDLAVQVADSLRVDWRVRRRGE